MLTRTIKIEVEVDITYPYRGTQRIRLTHPELSGALVRDVEDDGEMDIDDAVELAIQQITVEDPEPEPEPEPVEEVKPQVSVSQNPAVEVIQGITDIVAKFGQIRSRLKK